MKTRYTLITKFVFISCTLPFFLFANEDETRVSVGEREKKDSKQTMSVTLLKKEETESNYSDDRVENKQWSGHVFNNYPPVYYPLCIHWLSSVSGFGESLELEDGSIWKVSYYDRYRANNWHSNDPLVLTQNHRWFSSYNYKIINKTTGASIETNLYFGPIKNGEYTSYVVDIDFNRRMVKAVNGHEEIIHWEICPKDWYEFEQWAVHDSIIIGYNSGWDSQYECILINVNLNQFVRATQL